MACWQDIIAIPAKKQDQPAVIHLTTGQTRRLLAAPDRSTRQGRRDASLLATLYDTAARVQELADLAVRDGHHELGDQLITAHKLPRGPCFIHRPIAPPALRLGAGARETAQQAQCDPYPTGRCGRRRPRRRESARL